MNKTCARCEKTVYPTEELKCLDKIQDDSGEMHGISQPTMSRLCKKVGCAIARKSAEFIKMPTLLAEQSQVQREFAAVCGFPHVIGAIDCTHIKIRKVGGETGQYFINRKGHYSINTQVWHKGCFKCQECGMTLNMRTYKGYGKLPYCESHVPKAKHTTMAETPELKRIAENTKIQSNVKYHADFERSKGKFTQVADDPETLRIKANTKIISNVAYHGDLEKKAHMERQRQINENGELVDVPAENYHQQLESYATEMLPPTQPPHLPPKTHYQTPATQHQHQNQNRNYKQETHKTDYPKQEPYQQKPENHQQYQTRQEPYQNRAEPYQNRAEPLQNRVDQHQNRVDQHQNRVDQHQNRVDQHQNRVDQHPNRADQHQSRPDQFQNQQYEQYYQQQRRYEDYQNQQHQKYDEYQNQYAYGQYTPQQQYGVGSQQKIGRIQDYDPLSDGPRTVPNTQRSSATLIYNSDPRKAGSHQPQQQPQRQIGRVADLDPLAGDQPRPASNHHQNQRVYIAMYDYEANDSDEVSFREGDLISNVTSIDEGWMTGQVLRTGRTGMLPANYVELANNTALH